MSVQDELRFTIHRNFCTTGNIGDVQGAHGQDPSAGRGARALVGMSPERLKVYLEEYAPELAFTPKEAGCEIEARHGGTHSLLRFIATLPLKGEAADAVRGMAKALTKLDGIRVSPVPDSLSIDGEGATLVLEAQGNGLNKGDALNRLREAVTPLGFAVKVADAPK